MRINKAFTLAEVLITLTILGVVSAITIPAIQKRQEERSTVTKVKKVYADLQKAFDMAVVEYGPFDKWINLDSNHDSSATGARNTLYSDRLIKRYFRVNQSCGIGGKDCGPTGDTVCKSLDGTLLSGNFNPCTSNTWIWNAVGTYNRSSIFTGMNIGIDSPRGDNNSCSWTKKTDKSCVISRIIVDVNGNKEPNQLGKDMFVFGISKTGIHTFAPGDSSSSFPFNYSYIYYYCNKNYKSASNGIGCTDWILKKGKMNYPSY